jgi:hypothetical protein
MWDLTVAQAHSFFVGSGAVLVHNKCGGNVKLPVGPGKETNSITSGWRGTNMTSERSLTYHAARHAEGVSTATYARDATSFFENLKYGLKGGGLPALPRVLRDGTRGLRVATPGGGKGGIVDLRGRVISFWYH